MDPPRGKSNKSTKKKKKGGKKKQPARDPLYDPHFSDVDAGRPPRSPRHYDSDDDSSFDEVNFSDAECPRINDEDDEGDEDDETLVKRLYKGPRKCRCCTNWVKTPPQSITEPKKKDKAAKYAVTARYASKKKDMQVTTSVHSIAVHSEHVKDVLRKVLGKRPDVNIGRGDANFYPPFQPLVHAWEELQTSVSALEGEAHEHGKAFLDVVEPEIGETIKDRDDLLSRGMITFDLLWTIYKPGGRVFCDINGVRHLMLITTTTDDLYNFIVNFQYWDVGYKTPLIQPSNEYVFPFSGTKKVTELGAIPFELFPDAECAFKELVKRGRKIRDMPRGGLKWFKGFVTTPTQTFGISSKKWVEGRVIIDAEEYDKRNTNTDAFAPLSVVNPIPLPDPPGLNSLKPVENEDNVNDDELAQSRSAVRGFSLTTKSWHEFEVDGLSDVEWNDQAFDQLVMQSRRKRLIKALVDSNQGRDSGFDDFIKGKGQGLIMLLSGRPGTGKTLTAESIAERIHLPLYSVHSSELSAVQAAGGDIESKLSEILHRAAHWNAVLLIDEADAFLETRNNWDLQRNQRVAVFLRLLEFYSGVLILTTNRRISFDPAFYSRIHLTLKFDDLDHGARSSVWKNFLRSIPNNVHEDDVKVLAEAKLNGRQIKNVVKMGSLLAHSEGETLCMEHLETMLEAVDEIAEEERASGGLDEEVVLERD